MHRCISPRDDLGSRTRSPQGLARPLVKPIILNSGEPVGTIACTIRELVQKPFREETFYEKKKPYKLSPFQGPALEITVVRRTHIQAFSRKKLYTHVGLLGPYFKKIGEPWHVHPY